MNNSLVLPRTVKQGTYVNFTTFLDETKGAIRAGSSVGNAQSRVNTLFEEKYKDKQFQSDVLTAYAISEDDGLGMVEDPTKISADKLAEIANLGSNEEIVAQAKEWYKERVLGSVPPLWSAGSQGGGLSIGSGTSKDLEFINNETVPFTAMTKDKEGDWIVDDASTVEMNFDTYSGFQSNLQGKSYTDARKFKYDIVGVGIKDGKIYADKQAVEDSGFWSIQSGKQFQRKAEEMTRAEFTRLPTDTRNLLKAKFGEEELMKMLGGKSVTSQEEKEEIDW